MKRGRKIKCIESPCKKLINGVFVFEDIIDKEKVHKKMKQSVSQEKSNKAPGWFTEWARENKKEEMLYREQEHIKQEKFNESILVRLDRIENDVSDIKKDVCVLKEKVTVLETDVSGLKKDVHDIKEDIDNIVKKNNLKR
ncbi:MAG: hypothetical protein Ta2E_08320 [Mycoplasmoidaceae bacterium]|nr:MAG: hypothetical protein Ta2E_08320 [Mycoplasmoidaceae bacterium]